MKQYGRPGGPHFVGDCMPFAHEGQFHLFYLLDENHHQGMDGLGGHQWAHASTTDLIHWEHHPLALPITEPFEGSICTGSVFFQEGTYYAFYATRMRDYTQHLSLAVSADGVHFTKTDPNPLMAPPPGYSPIDFRDPFVFREENRFQMLITSKIAEYPLHDRGGCLLRLSSDNLRDWREEGPFLIPGDAAGYLSVPECPDYFRWNGWRYLLFGLGLQTRYRMSRAPDGPWVRPPDDTLGNRPLAVMKTASFGDNRRIGAAWIGTRKDADDSGSFEWGGNVVFREVIQRPDGTLGTTFPAEMTPTGTIIPLSGAGLTAGADVSEDGRRVTIAAPEALSVAALGPMPLNFRLRCRITPTAGTYHFGLGLRGEGAFASYYPLSFFPGRRVVQLAGETLEFADNIAAPFSLEIIAQDDLIDVCLAGERCLINRLGEWRGEKLFIFAHGGTVITDNLEVERL